ncbi:MAG: Endoglucanase [Ramlibacter sp.]|jgi:hypothetical protein|nr:Endoglucanase [Ramlibacter sp.]
MLGFRRRLRPRVGEALVAAAGADKSSPYVDNRVMQHAAAFALLSALLAVPAVAQIVCDDHGKIRQGSKTVFNNIWGTSDKGDPVKGYRQCASVERDGTVRFEWSNFERGRGRVKSYPHITLGWDWDNTHSGAAFLPMGIQKATGLASTFEVESRGRGTHNLAFDIWLSRERHPTEPRKQLTHEVMIWLDKTEWDIPRRKKARVTFDGRDFDLYVDDTAYGSWKVISFVAVQPMLSGRLALAPFFRYMVQEGLAQGDEFINGISFGNEIGYGEGRTTIRRFDVISR